jgi:hypothetical protein
MGLVAAAIHRHANSSGKPINMADSKDPWAGDIKRWTPKAVAALQHA